MRLGTRWWGQNPRGLSGVRLMVSHPATFPDTTLLLHPGDQPLHGLQGSEHLPSLPLPPSSPFLPSLAHHGPLTPPVKTRCPWWPSCCPGCPAGSKRLCQGVPTRPSPSGPEPPGALLSFTGSQALLGLSGSHLSCGMGVAGEADEVRGVFGGKEEGLLDGRGSPGCLLDHRESQAESQGRLG